MLWHKRPGLRRGPEEHLRDLDPILAVWTREERFCVTLVISL